MPTFYVYELWDPLKNEPFYVGKGKNIEELNYKRLKPKHTKKINQYSLSGEKIKEWNSQLDIKRELGFRNDIISNIIRGKRPSDIYMGFKWGLA